MAKKKLTSEEIISRIEQAPEAMRLMVAKAFIRDDIPNEDVQYTFNEDDIGTLVEDGTYENQNEEEIEGIGAVGFAMRTTKPGQGNKNYIRTASGGWNPCVKGNPMDAYCNVLANCVGYACGRFAEIINSYLGTTGCKYNTLCCNAENFVERAVAAGLKTGSTPRIGAIMCWQKGTLASSDGAGHVAIVERINSDGSVYTSESGYGSSAFWNSTRSNSNGRWGIGAGYTFRCFIYLPDNVQALIDETPEPTPQPTPTPTKSIEEVAKEVIAGKWGNGDDRKKRLEAAGYNYSQVQAKVNELLTPAKPSTPTPAPTPTPTLKVGDKVKIVGTGNGSSYGKGATAYGIGWTRQILKIWEGRAYPYQVGNNSGITGFYKAEALKKI